MKPSIVWNLWPYAHTENVYEGVDNINGAAQYSSHVTLIQPEDQVKVSGLSEQVWKDIATKIDPVLQWKSMSNTGSTFEGYFSYKVVSQTPWKLYATNGGAIHKPCGHVIVAVVSGAMDYAKAHELQPIIWAAKLKFMTATPTSHYKTLQKKINGEYVCSCLSKDTYPPTFDFMAYPAEAVDMTAKAPALSGLYYSKPAGFVPEPFVEKQPTKPSVEYPLDYVPVAADALVDGETDYIPGEKRKVEVATAGLYILEEIFAGVMAAPPYLARGQWRDMRDLRRVEFIRRFRKVHTEYGQRLARNFFDYLTIACFGEARYRDGHSYKLGVKGGKQSSRSTAYQTALLYDPRHLLPVMEQVFGRIDWGGGYGGPKWSFIAKQAQWYFKLHMAPASFADHVVDLAHNGGLAFNKGYIITNPSSKSEYMGMLTTKRAGFLTREWKHKLEVPEEVYRVMVEAIGLGFLGDPVANIWPAQDTRVPTLKWGNAKLKAEFLTPPMDLKQFMEKMEDDEAPAKLSGFKSSKLVGSPALVKGKLLEAR